MVQVVYLSWFVLVRFCGVVGGRLRGFVAVCLCFCFLP